MIFAAGLGTRLKPITDTMPKALVPVGGKPLLQWQLEKLKKAGIVDVVINLHHFPEQIRSFIKENDAFGCRVQFSDESDCLLETGGGLRKAASLFRTDEPILVLNVDVLNTLDINVLVASYDKRDAATLVVSERQTQRYLLFDEKGLLVGWHNKSTGEYRPIQRAEEIGALHREGGLRMLAFSGTHIVTKRIFEKMWSMPDCFPIIDYYISVCEELPIRAYIPDHFQMLDVGKLETLSEADNFVGIKK